MSTTSASDCNCPHRNGVVARNMCGHDNTCPAYARWAATNLQQTAAGSVPDDCDFVAPELKITPDEAARLALFFKEYAARATTPAAPTAASAAPTAADPLPPDAPRSERYVPARKRGYGGLKFRRF